MSGSPLEAINQPPPVRAYATKFVQRTERNLPHGCLAGNPHLAIAQQAQRAAGEVGACELHAGPFLADKPGFGDGYQLADVPAVHFHQRGAGKFQVGWRSIGDGLGGAVSVQHAVGVLPQADEGGAVFALAAIF